MGNLVTAESYELYQYYVALKQHFTKADYDFFKYAGKMKLSSSSLEKRRDKSFFYMIAKHQRDPKAYVFANVLNNPDIWIGDIANDKDNSDRVFVSWERRMQSLSYSFKEEIGNMLEDFDQNFLCEDGKHPVLFRLYMTKKISLETLVILDMVLSFSRYWDKVMKNDPMWSDVSNRIKKYKPFLEINVGKFKKILQDKFV